VEVQQEGRTENGQHAPAFLRQGQVWPMKELKSAGTQEKEWTCC